jgi:DNA polymerase I-like protein with 3'-5' exonuclease and polymerase domains
MAKHAKVPIHEVEAFQRNYFGALPCIPEYHQWVRNELRESASLVTLFNRRRFFFGRHNDDATLREAVAFSPQSMTAEEINIGMLRLWRSARIQLLCQVHDSILFQYPEHLEAEIIPFALETLRVYLDLNNNRRFVVPTEAKVGWNWGDASPSNPDGLVKWKGGDDRKRQRKDFKLSFMGTANATAKIVA